MRVLAKLLGICALLAAPAAAAPEIRAILNAASYALPGMPNSAIAQGSIFVVFGSEIGPPELRQAAGFPLTTGLGGTSVRVMVGTTTVDALILYAWEKQVAAILPSSTPTGVGLLSVTYDGRASQWGAFRIVPSSPGILSQSQNGSGQALAQNFNSATDQPRNTLSRPARPGQLVTLWGTGLGPVAGNEAMPPVPRNLDLNLQVLVGGKAATVSYKGRSGCCAGVDQIIFEVPRDVEGCYVPVVVRAGEAISNFTTISVAAPGAECADLSGLSGPSLELLQGGGDLRFGSISLFVGPGYDDFDQPIGLFESGSAYFLRAGAAALSSVVPVGLPSPGSCQVFVSSGPVGVGSAPPPLPLDAGPALNLAGPKGTRQLPRRGPGNYSEQFSAGVAQVQYLEPGTYTVDNGPGGPDVGAFRATITAAPALTTTVQGAAVTWRGGDPAGFVTIAGSAQSPLTGSFAFFRCTERVSAGQFTVPSYVLSSLPAAPRVSVSPERGASPQNRFRAPGLDAGYFSFVSTQ